MAFYFASLPPICYSLKKITTIIIFLLMATAILQAQKAVSVGTDVSILRNFTRDQSFTTVGQTIHFNAHFSSKEALYAWVSYYVNGKYKNDLQALARDPFSTPLHLNYTASSKMGLRQISIGWKHYLKGTYNNDSTWNLYAKAGFGLLTGKIENSYDPPVDTALYFVPQKAIEGTGHFNRLTFDLALGVEYPIGSAVYLFGEARTWLQSSDYPSPYMYNNKMPQVLMLNGGLRVLFE